MMQLRGAAGKRICGLSVQGVGRRVRSRKQVGRGEIAARMLPREGVGRSVARRPKRQRPCACRCVSAVIGRWQMAVVALLLVAAAAVVVAASPSNKFDRCGWMRRQWAWSRGQRWTSSMRRYYAQRWHPLPVLRKLRHDQTP